MNNTPVILRPLILAGVLAMCGLASAPANAQTPSVWQGIGFIAVDGGAQVTSSGYTSNLTFPLHGETATGTATSDAVSGAVFTARGGIRIWKNLALGAGVTVFSSTPDVAVEASLPHPFFFNRPREVSGTASGLTRRETMAAVEVSWLVPLSRRMDMSLFAGPAFFNVRQDMVTTVQFTETYPYDTATFAGVESEEVSRSVTGFTVGADVSYLFSKNFGLGGQFRFSRASTTLTPSGGQSTAVDLGGAQVGGGIRIRF
ncbi:MAG: outer membrane beta-barrel protein [Acidobacteria bacterium]|nr:outer membrane beta-barrel protein [Acidobacteriota bacterium]